MHTGGPKVLAATAEALQLPKGALDASLASYEMALAMDHSLETAISGRLGYRG